MSDPLSESLLARVGDLAHYMLERDIRIQVASGNTPNGHPCTVFVAIGDDAEMARIVAEAIVKRVSFEAMRDQIRAERN